mmetsp:Transcript_57628/g.171922  ORF Transcript_57628/g.171922 Transcript_57628/m.171922 type:complete len:144 (-) Transcript_57628:1033-1464(-)
MLTNHFHHSGAHRSAGPRHKGKEKCFSEARRHVTKGANAERRPEDRYFANIISQCFERIVQALSRIQRPQYFHISKQQRPLLSVSKFSLAVCPTEASGHTGPGKYLKVVGSRMSLKEKIPGFSHAGTARQMRYMVCTWACKVI